MERHAIAEGSAALVALAGFYFDGFGFGGDFAAEDLAFRGGGVLGEGAEFDGAAGAGGFIDGFDDGDVDEAFGAAALDVGAVAAGAGEGDEFGGELVAFGIFLRAGGAVFGEGAAEFAGVFKGGIEADVAARADDLEPAGGGGAEGATEGGEACAGEAEGDGDGFFDVLEAGVGAAGGHGDDFGGLGGEEVASGVEGVDADIEEGAAAHEGAEADVIFASLKGEAGGEEAGLAEFLGAEEAGGLHVGLLEVEAVGDHEADVVFGAGVDHGLAVAARGGHRLFAEDVDAVAGRADGVFAVEGVGEGDIEGVEEAGFTGGVEFGIIKGVGEAVLPGEGGTLGGVAADDGGELAFAAGVGEGGEDGFLGDVAGAEEGEAEGGFRLCSALCGRRFFRRGVGRRGGRGFGAGGGLGHGEG